MSGFAVAAGLGGIGAATGAPPVRLTDSSTVKFSSRSLAATRRAVSASLNAPTCTQYGPLAADGLGVVAVAAARLGAGVGSAGRAVGGSGLLCAGAAGDGVEGVTGAGISVESFLSLSVADDGVEGVATEGAGALDATAGFEGGGV